MSVQVKKINRAVANRKLALYTVSVNGVEVGSLEKWYDTRSTKNPWKAYLGVGREARLLGFFYQEDGGKGAAVELIIASVK